MMCTRWLVVWALSTVSLLLAVTSSQAGVILSSPAPTNPVTSGGTASGFTVVTDVGGMNVANDDTPTASPNTVSFNVDVTAIDQPIVARFFADDNNSVQSGSTTAATEYFFSVTVNSSTFAFREFEFTLTAFDPTPLPAGLDFDAPTPLPAPSSDQPSTTFTWSATNIAYVSSGPAVGLGDSATYTFSVDVPEIAGDWGPGQGFDLTMAASVATVPEPGSLVLAGMCASMLGAGAFWRRRRGAKDSPVEPSA